VTESPMDTWNPDDFMDLIPDIYRMDNDAIYQWTRARLTTRRRTIQFIYLLAHSAAGVMRLIADREGGKFSGFGMVETGPGTTRAQLLGARFLTATLNDDRDMQKALMDTLIEYTESTEDVGDIAQVQAQLVLVFSSLLHEMAEPQGDTE